METKVGMNMETNDPMSTGEISFEEPFNELLPEFQALSPNELAPMNIDIPSAATTVLGVQRAALDMKERIAEELPKFDQALPGKMNLYALALLHAHSLYVMATSPADALQPMVDEGTKLHATLLADAGALVQRGLVDGQHLRDLKGCGSAEETPGTSNPSAKGPPPTVQPSGAAASTPQTNPRVTSAPMPEGVLRLLSRVQAVGVGSEDAYQAELRQYASILDAVPKVHAPRAEFAV